MKERGERKRKTCTTQQQDNNQFWEDDVQIFSA